MRIRSSHFSAQLRSLSSTNLRPAVRFGRIATCATVPLLLLIGVARAQVPECVPGTLADYEKLGPDGCAVGRSRLSNFHYQQTSDGLSPDAISITPGVSPNNDDPGVLIEGKWTSEMRHRSSISYTLDAPVIGKGFAGATLEMQFGQVTGAGTAKVATQICPPASPENCSGAGARLHVLVSTRADRKVSDQAQLKTSLHQVRVTSTIELTAGKNDAASFNGFMTVFHLSGKPPSSATPKAP